MNLFLAGGGGREDSKQLDTKFVALLNLSKPILYIPIAIDTTKYPYSDCVAWIQSILGPYGVTNIVMWTEGDLKNKVETDFEQFTAVYIGGGNTFKLLKELKDFGTLAILKTLAKRNIPIYGGSAGAIILAKTIIPAASADPNDVGLTDLGALNLVNNFDIWCHYVPENDATIRAYMQQYNLEKIIAIPETAGLYVTEEHIETVGPASVKVFAEGKEWEVLAGNILQ